MHVVSCRRKTIKEGNETMIYRPVDGTGDMMPITSKSQLARGSEAVLQAVQSRIRLLVGEWWEDESAGFEIPAFLFSGTRFPLGVDMLTSYLQAYILETDGVGGVSVSVSQNNRKTTFSCAISAGGETLETEMDENELLRAIY